MINKTSLEKRFTRLPPAFGVISALLGLSVIIGWNTHCESLLQISPSFVVMQYNTAIGFLLCGMGLVALAYGRLRLSTVAGSLVTALALLTLIEYIFSCDLGIDQLFMKHYITSGVSNPGRMAPNTAVCFLLTGIALLILRWTGLSRPFTINI